jgi:PHD/YefM family antitoxin component YafN of YafNO toxin-antitoxin module
MILQYITDDSGQKNAVLLPIKDWENLQNELKELQILRQYKEKYLFLEGLKEAMIEVKQHNEGKIKLQTAKDFLNEL